MEMPLVTETPGLLQPLDRDPFLIGLGGPPTAPPPDSAPSGHRAGRDRTTS